MKRIAMFISLSFFVFSINAFGQKIEFEVKGIGIGEDYQTVLDKLGKPLTSKNDGMNPCGGTKRILTYSGLKIVFDEGENKRSTVKSIEVNSSKWEVTKGLKIGANTETVKQIYGESARGFNEGVFDVATYYDGDGNLNFYFRNGKLFKAIRDLNLC